MAYLRYWPCSHMQTSCFGDTRYSLVGEASMSLATDLRLPPTNSPIGIGPSAKHEAEDLAALLGRGHFFLQTR